MTWALPSVAQTPPEVRGAIAQRDTSWLDNPLYGLPRPRTLFGAPYEPAPELLPVPVTPADDLAKRGADLERYLGLVADSNRLPAWCSVYAPELLAPTYDDITGNVAWKSPPLGPGEFVYAPELGPPAEPLRYGMMHLEIHMRGFQLEPILQMLYPAEAFDLELQPPSRPRLTLQEFAMEIQTLGLDDSDGDSLVIDERGGQWVICAWLGGVGGCLTYFVGEMDEPPEDWEPSDNEYTYTDGPMYKRAERLMQALNDPMACLALANGQPPNFDGLPPLPEPAP